MRIVYFILPLLIIGCSSHPMDPDMNFKPPKYVEQMPSKEVDDSQSLGSLFGNGENTLFADKKAMKVNDIVTVLITEKVKSKTAGKKQTSEIANTPLSGANMLIGAGSHLTGMAGMALGLHKLPMPSISSTRNFTGSGSDTREESFTANVTARIIKVLKNGNYFIAGSRSVLVNGEKHIIRVAGVIRPSDIDSSNTIDSKYIADAKIEYKTEGDISRATDKNWFVKFLDAVSPW